MLKRRGMPMVLPRALGAFFGRERLAIAGVAAIELAMVSPLLVTGVLGAGELGITIFRQTQVGNAAQAGADYAIAHGFDAAKISNAIVNATNTSGFVIAASPAPTQFCGCGSANLVTVNFCGIASPSAVTVATCGNTCSNGAKAGTYVLACSKATFSPIIPNPWQKNPVTLTAQAIARIK
jgi:Flp pilus assembly protein TadG